MLSRRDLAIACALFTCTPALAQHEWTLESMSPGTSGFIGVSEDFLTMGDPWDPDSEDMCAQLYDVRCEWVTEHTGGDEGHAMNGVLAATLDGSSAPQQVVFLSDVWPDLVSSGSPWWVTYDAHFVGIDPADIPNLRWRSRYIHNGVTQLVLNLPGLATEDRVQFRVAPLHIWTETPETGTQWQIELTALRTQTGEPAMVWLDNIHITEGEDLLYDETFPVEQSSAPQPPAARLVTGLSVYPNPSFSSARIGFQLNREGFVDARVLDVTGRIVRSLLSRSMTSGRHLVSWDGLDAAGRDAPGGVYLIRLTSGGGSAVRKVVKID